MARKKINNCKNCGLPVKGRTYKNAEYCIDCLQYHPRYSSEYHKDYSRQYNKDYYQRMKFISSCLVAAGMTEREVNKNEDEYRFMESTQ
jgi:predicted amidophosphoribosyltransferase